MTPQRGGDDDVTLRAFDALREHEQLADLVARTQDVARGMASARNADFSALPPPSSEEKDDAPLGDGGDRGDAGKTPFGDALSVLTRGPETDNERALAQALWAHSLAEESWGEVQADDRLATDILWLAAHSPFDATPLIDHALGEEADTVWNAIADRVRRVDAHQLPELGRGEALVGCVALAASPSVAAQRIVASLIDELHDPAFVRVLASKAVTEPEGTRLSGEIVPAPRGFIATTALALTGILFLLHGGRLLARLALAYRHPAEITLSSESVRIDSRIEVLGRTLRERSTVISREGLARAVREIRYPRLGFYAGLLALALGTYVGVSAAVDGVRSASPSLVLVGVLLIAAGIGLDLVLSSILPGTRGLCRIVFVPRKGSAVCIGSVDIERADAALGSVARAP